MADWRELIKDYDKAYSTDAQDQIDFKVKNKIGYLKNGMHFMDLFGPTEEQKKTINWGRDITDEDRMASSYNATIENNYRDNLRRDLFSPTSNKSVIESNRNKWQEYLNSVDNKFKNNTGLYPTDEMYSKQLENHSSDLRKELGYTDEEYKNYYKELQADKVGKTPMQEVDEELAKVNKITSNSPLFGNNGSSFAKVSSLNYPNSTVVREIDDNTILMKDSNGKEFYVNKGDKNPVKLDSNGNILENNSENPNLKELKKGKGLIGEIKEHWSNAEDYIDNKPKSWLSYIPGGDALRTLDRTIADYSNIHWTEDGNGIMDGFRKKEEAKQQEALARIAEYGPLPKEQTNGVLPTIGRVFSGVKNSLAPYQKTVDDYVYEYSQDMNGNKLVNMGADLVGGIGGMVINPGYTYGGPGTNLLNITDNMAQQGALKVSGKLGKAGTTKANAIGNSILRNGARLTIDGAMGGALDTPRLGQGIDELPENVVRGAVGAVVLGGAIQGGGALAKAGKDGFNNAFNSRMNDLDEISKSFNAVETGNVKDIKSSENLNEMIDFAERKIANDKKYYGDYKKESTHDIVNDEISKIEDLSNKSPQDLEVLRKQHIDNINAIQEKMQNENISLEESSSKLGLNYREEFDKIKQIEEMLKPKDPKEIETLNATYQNSKDVVKNYIYEDYLNKATDIYYKYKKELNVETKKELEKSFYELTGSNIKDMKSVRHVEDTVSVESTIRDIVDNDKWNDTTIVGKAEQDLGIDLRSLEKEVEKVPTENPSSREYDNITEQYTVERDNLMEYMRDKGYDTSNPVDIQKAIDETGINIGETNYNKDTASNDIVDFGERATERNTNSFIQVLDSDKDGNITNIKVIPKDGDFPRTKEEITSVKKGKNITDIEERYNYEVENARKEFGENSLEYKKIKKDSEIKKNNSIKQALKEYDDFDNAIKKSKELNNSKEVEPTNKVQDITKSEEYQDEIYLSKKERKPITRYSEKTNNELNELIKKYDEAIEEAKNKYGEHSDQFEEIEFELKDRFSELKRSIVSKNEPVKRNINFTDGQKVRTENGDGVIVKKLLDEGNNLLGYEVWNGEKFYEYTKEELSEINRSKIDETLNPSKTENEASNENTDPFRDIMSDMYKNDSELKDVFEESANYTSRAEALRKDNIAKGKLVETLQSDIEKVNNDTLMPKMEKKQKLKELNDRLNSTNKTIEENTKEYKDLMVKIDNQASAREQALIDEGQMYIDENGIRRSTANIVRKRDEFQQPKKGFWGALKDSYDSFLMKNNDKSRKILRLDEKAWEYSQNVNKSIGKGRTIITKTLVKQDGTPLTKNGKEYGSYMDIYKDSNGNPLSKEDVDLAIELQMLRHNIARANEVEYRPVVKDGEPVLEADGTPKRQAVMTKEGKPIMPSLDKATTMSMVNKIETERPDIKTIADKHDEWWNAFEDEYLVKSGLSREEYINNLKRMYNHYINTRRAGYEKASPITIDKRITGSDRDIINPLDTMMEGIMAITRKVAYNDLKVQTYMAIMKQNQDGNFKYGEILGSGLKHGTENKDVFKAQIGGFDYYFKVNDTKMIESIENANKSVGIDWVKKGATFNGKEITPSYGDITKGFKTLFTKANPIFSYYSNRYNDKFSSSVISDMSFLEYRRYYKNAKKDVKTNSARYQQMKALGVGQSGRYENLSVDELADMVLRTKDVKERKHLMKLIDMYSTGAENVEMYPRMAVFNYYMDKTGGDWQKSLFEASQGSTDFSMHGTAAKKLNDLTGSFYTAGVSALDRTGRAFVKKGKNIVSEAKQGSFKTLGKEATKIGAIYTAPTVFLWMVNKDNESYQELPGWRKDLFYNIPILPDKKEFIMLPKGRIVGILLSSILERSLDTAFTDRTFGENFGELAQSTYSEMPKPTDTVWDGATVDLWKNKDFANRTIEPTYMQNYAPKDRYNQYTSEVAKFLGGMFGVSPMKLEHVFNSYTGFWGNFISSGVDLATGSKDLEGAFDKAIGNKFIANPLYSSKSSEKYYNSQGELSRLKQSSKNGKLVDNLNPQEKSKYDTIANIQSIFTEKGGYNDQIAKLNEKKRNTKDSKEKDKLQAQIVELMRKANEEYNKDLESYKKRYSQ